MKNKRAQIWIETVLYTLIGLAVISLLIAAARPKISELQDQMIVQQSIEALAKFDEKMLDIRTAVGNKRVIELGLKKGELVFDAEKNIIDWNIKDTKYMYSEPSSPEKEIWVSIGSIKALTQKNNEKSKIYDIILRLNYTEIAKLTIDGEETIKTIQKASTPYKIIIENTGLENNKINIDIRIQ